MNKKKDIFEKTTYDVYYEDGSSRYRTGLTSDEAIKAATDLARFSKKLGHVIEVKHKLYVTISPFTLDSVD